jgi:hypothetical protein
MKKLILAFIAIVSFGFSTAMAQNTNTNPAITQFVTQHFPNATVQMVMPDEDDIDVVLNDYTKIEFRLNNEWKKVDCEHSTTFTAVPATIVPEQITAYVTANFPNAIIKKLEKQFRGWEIELNNGLELKFNSNFRVMEIDD